MRYSPKHEHRTRIFRSRVLDRYIIPPAALRPQVALLFENMDRLTNPRSARPDTPAAHRPPDCRLVHPDARREQRVPCSRQRRPDPIDAPRPEERADLPARKFRPGFREPDQQGEPGPIPCHLPMVRSAQRSSPAFPRPHRAANSALPKKARQIYSLSATARVVPRITNGDCDPHRGGYVERYLAAASSGTKPCRRSCGASASSTWPQASSPGPRQRASRRSGRLSGPCSTLRWLAIDDPATSAPPAMRMFMLDLPEWPQAHADRRLTN